MRVIARAKGRKMLSAVRLFLAHACSKTQLFNDLICELRMRMSGYSPLGNLATDPRRYKIGIGAPGRTENAGI